MKRKYGEYLPEGTCVVLAGKECRISGAPLAETTECILYPAELLGPGKLLSGFALMEGGPDAALQGPYILGSGAGTFQKYVSAGEAVIARRGRKEKTVRGSFALLDHVPQKLRPLRRKKARDGFRCPAWLLDPGGDPVCCAAGGADRDPACAGTVGRVAG